MSIYQRLSALTILFLLLPFPEATAVSSWNPTLLVNTESFQILDEGDGTTDISVQFGDTLAETLTYDRSVQAFTFSHDVSISGNLSASGSFTVNSDQIGPSQIVFGASVNQSINLDSTGNAFSFSTGATVLGLLSGSTLGSASLQSCSLLTTDAAGTILCGSETTATGGALAVVQARRTTGFTLGATYADLTFDATDLENAVTVINHDDSQRDRINILSDGLYNISYKVTANDNATTSGIAARVRINDTLTASGSFLEAIEYQNEYVPTTVSFLAELSAGDYITLQVQLANGNPADIINDSTLSVVRLEGVVGPKGDPGEVDLVALDQRYLNTSGDTMTGDLLVNNADLEVSGTISGTTLLSDGGYRLPVILHHDGSSTVATGAGYQTLKSFTVPGGTLGTTNSVAIVAWVRRNVGTGGARYRLQYGGQTIAEMSGANSNDPVQIEAVLLGNGSTGSQRGYIDHTNSGNTGTDSATSAVDSTIDQTLTLQVDLSTDANQFTCDSIRAIWYR